MDWVNFHAVSHIDENNSMITEIYLDGVRVSANNFMSVEIKVKKLVTIETYASVEGVSVVGYVSDDRHTDR